jgi:hypothetical protein
MNRTSGCAGIPKLFKRLPWVKSRIRKRAGSMKGVSERMQCATNSASVAAAAAKLSETPYEFHPQSFSFTIPKVSALMPMVISAAAQ